VTGGDVIAVIQGMELSSGKKIKKCKILFGNLLRKFVPLGWVEGG